MKVTNDHYLFFDACRPLPGWIRGLAPYSGDPAIRRQSINEVLDRIINRAAGDRSDEVESFRAAAKLMADLRLYAGHANLSTCADYLEAVAKAAVAYTTTRQRWAMRWLKRLRKNYPQKSNVPADDFLLREVVYQQAWDCQQDGEGNIYALMQKLKQRLSPTSLREEQRIVRTFYELVQAGNISPGQDFEHPNLPFFRVMDKPPSRMEPVPCRNL